MIQPVRISTVTVDEGLDRLTTPLPLASLVPGEGEWEVEIGFGKAKYLLRRCVESPERRFLGIEFVGGYQRLFVDRARRDGARNWIALRGEALYLLTSVLPKGFASVVHVYFPDPWPKQRHRKRRLFDPETVDLVLGLLRPGGRLLFATDFLEYGELVLRILAGCPSLTVARHDGPWPEGARTHYEEKYEEEGRPILRCEATLADPAVLHPTGRIAVLAGMGAVPDADSPDVPRRRPSRREGAAPRFASAAFVAKARRAR